MGRIVRRSFRRAGRLAPATAGALRARMVALRRGEAMPWHSTAGREELLIALRGRLEVRTATRRGRGTILRAGDSLFLPRRTAHHVANRSAVPAHYIYVTAPVVARRASRPGRRPPRR